MYVCMYVCMYVGWLYTSVGYAQVIEDEVGERRPSADRTYTYYNLSCHLKVGL